MEFAGAKSKDVDGTAVMMRSLMYVYLCCCIDMLGHALTIATMPYYVRSFGGSASTVGLVISLWAAGNIVSSVWMGIASDRIGRRPILILSLICSSIGFLLTALATDLRSLMAARLFLGLTSGSLPVGQSYIADVVTVKEDRAKTLANLSALNALAVMVGPPLGSLLAYLTPLGLKGPFFAGCVGAAVGAIFAAFNLLSKEQLERLRNETPQAKARARWAKCRQEYVPSLELRNVSFGERWGTVYAAVFIAGSSAMLNATPAVLLALGPLSHIGLGHEAFGVILMGMGLCGALVQLKVFRPLLASIGIFYAGAVGAVCSAGAPVFFLLVGRFPCVPAADASPLSCLLQSASIVDLLALAAGSALFAAGFILCSACVSPVLVQSATPKTTGMVVGLGGMGSAVGRALGPATWGMILRASNVATGFLSAFALGSCVLGAWMLARTLDAAEDERRANAGRRKLQIPPATHNRYRSAYHTRAPVTHARGWRRWMLTTVEALLDYLCPCCASRAREVVQRRVTLTKMGEFTGSAVMAQSAADWSFAQQPATNRAAVAPASNRSNRAAVAPASNRSNRAAIAPAATDAATPTADKAPTSTRSDSDAAVAVKRTPAADNTPNTDAPSSTSPANARADGYVRLED